MDAPAVAAAAVTVSSASNDSSPTARQQPQPPPQSQQTSSQPSQQQSQQTSASLVVSTSGSIPLVSSGNTVVLPFTGQNAGLMTQAAGVAQNSIRLQQQQQQPQQQHLIMAPVNNTLMYSNYLSPHQIMAHPGNQFIIQNLNTLPNQSFLMPPHSTNIATVTGRRSGIITGQNIQPRPQAQIFRPNMTQQIIAQSSGVSTTPTNIQPRPQQSFIPASPILRANITPQLFAQQSFPAVFNQNQTGLCWAPQNSGFIFRNQNDPIQILSPQTQLQNLFMQNNVHAVPAAPAPVVSVTPAVTAAVPTTTQATPSAATPRMKPIAVRPASGSTTVTLSSASTSMGTQTTMRTTTTVADATKNNITRTKVVSGPGRPATATSSPIKPANGPATPVRDTEVTSARSAATSHPPVIKTDVTSTNSAIPTAGDHKGDIKVSKASPAVAKNNTGSNHNSNKEAAGDRVQTVRRPSDKRDIPAGHENPPVSGGLIKKSEPPRLRNGFKSQNECNKTPETENLIHVIEDFVIEESSTPFPVNGTTDPPHPENGISRSGGASNRPDSPEELIISTPRLPDAGECQKCQNTGPKSRLKMKNGMRLCQTCFSKRPPSKLDILNSVTSSPSEYDFRDNDNHQVEKGTSAVITESEAVTDSRKRPRLSKKTAVNSDTPVCFYCLISLANRPFDCRCPIWRSCLTDHLFQKQPHHLLQIVTRLLLQ